MYRSVVSALLHCLATAYAMSGIDLAYSNVRQETIAGETVLEYGSVPTWISGSLLRQSCGAYGETGSDLPINNKITHLLDCIEMGQSFRFDNGTVTFYNRYFDTAIVDVWKQYGMNMNDSKVFWRTIYSENDWDQVRAFWDRIENDETRTKVRQVPHVTWWQIGDQVYAHSEYPSLVQVHAHDVTNSLVYHQFDDDNFGYSGLEAIVNEPSHETMEPDGTIYSSHMTYVLHDPQNGPMATVKQWTNLYKIEGNSRSTVTKLPYPDLDLSLCDGSGEYPHHEHKQGYMHSFAMTERYIIVPESSYLCDVCNVFPQPFGHYNASRPYYDQFFDWHGEVPSRVWVVRKSDGEIVAQIRTEAFFATHQLNAYEDGHLIHADMITYNYGLFYTRDTFVDRLTSEEPYEAWLHRFTIDTRDWSLLERTNLLPTHQPIELPMINPAFLTRPYQYVYYVHGIHTALPQNLTKLNVVTGEVEAFYEMPEGFFPQEPTFLQTPEARGEDDGIILLPGIDSVKEKGFLMIFDARDLTLMTHLTGTDLMLAGLHSKFFPPHIGNMPGVEKGYTNIQRETVNGETKLLYGEVPRWLNGSLLRQSCGAYGETGSDLPIYNRVDHLLDCIEMGQSFKFNDGNVTFYNRYFDTAIVDVFKEHNMDMTNSSVFWRTIYSDFDYDKVLKYWDRVENDAVREKVRQMPHVTWWRIGNKVVGHSEYPLVVEVDVHEVTNSPTYYEFDDNNFGYNGFEAIVNELSHEAEDFDGTLYNAHMTYVLTDPFDAPNKVSQWKNVYKIVGNTRSTVAKLPYPDMDLDLCHGNNSYPFHGDKQGYMHSFTMTEQYIVVPESSYLCDVCTVFPDPYGYYDPSKPYYDQFFEWFEDAPSRVWVVRKSDGRIMAHLNTTAFFVTHQLNAYEDGHFIHADMITYNYGLFYTRDTYVDRLSGTEPFEAWLHRFTIDTRDWTLHSRTNLLPTHRTIELPSINPVYSTKPYQYVYYTDGIHTGLPQNFTKLNINTGEVEAYYEMADGEFPQEANFVPTPGAVDEDDGVLLLPGLDVRRDKGFLMIFDARDLRLMAHLLGTDFMLFGLHGKFFPPHIGNIETVAEEPVTSVTLAAGSLSTSLVFLLVMIVIQRLLS